MFSRLFIGILRGIVFAVFGSIHSMWRMFDEDFPFFVAVILAVHNETMSPMRGILFAFIDGALVGLLSGWVSSRILKF